MATAPDARILAEALPGNWVIAATNFPYWLGGTRFAPMFTYTLLREEPLVLADDLSYQTVDGASKHILGTDRWGRGGFRWRGKGVQRLLVSHWTVAALNEDQTIAVVRFSKSLVTPAGIDIIVREGAVHSELRAAVAHGAGEFGLSAEDFASLAWLDDLAGGHSAT